MAEPRCDIASHHCKYLQYTGKYDSRNRPAPICLRRRSESGAGGPKRGLWPFRRKGGMRMVRTIKLASCISVQGTYVRTLPNGKMDVRVGDRIFSGRPVSKAA